jgi:splicing factor, arginine/serine-rich 4/5/6
MLSRRILEYLNREDAERAVKDLSGRDLRGQAVRVDLHDDVSAFSVYIQGCI